MWHALLRLLLREPKSPPDPNVDAPWTSFGDPADLDSVRWTTLHAQSTR